MRDKSIHNKHIGLLMQVGIILVGLVVLLLHRDQVILLPLMESDNPLGSYTEEGQVFVDESCQNKGYCVLTKPMTLQAGSYRVVVEYDASYDQYNRVDIITKDQQYDSMIADSAKFYVDETEATGQIWVWRDTKEVSLGVYYCGAGSMLVKDVTLIKTNAMNRMGMFLLIILIILLNLISYLYRKARKPMNILSLYFACSYVLLGVFLSYPLFTNYLNYGDSLYSSLGKIEAVYSYISRGGFPITLVSSGTEGYVSSVWYLFPALLRWIGFPLQFAYKFYLLFLNLCAVAISTICFERIFHNKWKALWGAYIYLLSITLLGYLYEQGSIVEVVGYIILPVICCGFYELLINKEVSLFLVLGLTGLIHTGLLCFVLAIVFLMILFLMCGRYTFRLSMFLTCFKSIILFFCMNMGLLAEYWFYAQNTDEVLPAVLSGNISLSIKVIYPYLILVVILLTLWLGNKLHKEWRLNVCFYGMMCIIRILLTTFVMSKLMLNTNICKVYSGEGIEYHYPRLLQQEIGNQALRYTLQIISFLCIIMALYWKRRQNEKRNSNQV